MAEMETYNSQDFADYFNEFRYIDDEVKSEEDSLEDETKITDDADSEWLAEVGLNPQVLVGQDNDDDDYDDKEEILEDFCKSLTYRQATILRKKYRSAKATIRKKKRAVKIRDVRDVFVQNAYETPTNEARSRSRSETPDSLDSLSSPSPPEWLPDVSNSSPVLSQGYHSGERTSPTYSSSGNSVELSSTALHRGHGAPGAAARKSRPRDASVETSQASNPSRPSPCPSDGITVANYPCDARSPPRSLSQFYVDSQESPPFSRGLLQKRDPVAGSEDAQCGVEILGFHNKNSVRGMGRLNALPLPSSPSSLPSQFRAVSTSDISLELKNDDEQDWGFENFDVNADDDRLITVDLTSDTLGCVTFLDDLGPQDVRQLQALILLELTYIYDQNKLHYSRRKPPKIKRKEVVSVFGIPLTTLIENDRKFVPHCKIPLILDKMLTHLERFGLREEGILRVPGSVHKIQAIKQEIETNFYLAPASVDQALRGGSVNDVTAALKQFLRELPVPLFTNEYIEAFFVLDRIADRLDQLKALKALILLIPEAHRNTLWALLSFLAKVIENERFNRMGLHNVAMIIAPNLFTSTKRQRSGIGGVGGSGGGSGPGADASKRDLASEMKTATSTCHLTKLMIKYREVLFCVPAFLVRQIRTNNDSAATRRNLKENNKPKRWLLSRKPKLEIYRKINNEVDFQNGIIRVNAPQMNVSDFPVQLTPTTSAGDVVSHVLLGRAMNNGTAEDFNHNRTRSAKIRQEYRRALSELAPNSNIGCLVAAASADSALNSHVLCEVGGNIGKRRLRHNTIVNFVYQSNPNAEWIIECRHNGSPQALGPHKYPVGD